MHKVAKPSSTNRKRTIDSSERNEEETRRMSESKGRSERERERETASNIGRKRERIETYVS